jgi:hypothetical protein
VLLGRSTSLVQGNNGRQRGVLVLDTWQKTAPKSKARRAAVPRSPIAGSWRSTPYASTPANGNNGSSNNISDASSAMAARSYYSMMNGNGSSSNADIASPTDGIYEPVANHQVDPNVMQLWTDKPRFGTSMQQPSYAAEHQEHQDAWRAQQPQQPRIFVPPPPSGSSNEAYARWQALQSVMAALQHSSGELFFTPDCILGLYIIGICCLKPFIVKIPACLMPLHAVGTV